jgi:hypothetical protein
MTVKSDPLAVLLEIKGSRETLLEDDLVRACYQLQSEHQYDKDRNTMTKMQALVEEVIVDKEGDKLL